MHTRHNLQPIHGPHRGIHWRTFWGPPDHRLTWREFCCAPPPPPPPLPPPPRPFFPFAMLRARQTREGERVQKSTASREKQADPFHDMTSLLVSHTDGPPEKLCDALALLASACCAWRAADATDGGGGPAKTRRRPSPHRRIAATGGRRLHIVWRNDRCDGFGAFQSLLPISFSLSMTPFSARLQTMQLSSRMRLLRWSPSTWTTSKVRAFFQALPPKQLY